jgi:hypothetical protein
VEWGEEAVGEGRTSNVQLRTFNVQRGGRGHIFEF